MVAQEYPLYSPASILIYWPFCLYCHFSAFDRTVSKRAGTVQCLEIPDEMAPIRHSNGDADFFNRQIRFAEQPTSLIQSQ
jgi:hypothetical protein